MLPDNFENKKIEGITRDGQNAPFKVRTIKGSDYAFVTVIPGNIYEITADYR